MVENSNSTALPIKTETKYSCKTLIIFSLYSFIFFIIIFSILSLPLIWLTDTFFNSTCYGACYIVIGNNVDPYSFLPSTLFIGYLVEFVITLATQSSQWHSGHHTPLIISFIKIFIIASSTIYLAQLGIKIAHTESRQYRWINSYLIIKSAVVALLLNLGIGVAYPIFIHILLAMSYFGIPPYDARNIPIEYFNNHEINFSDSKIAITSNTESGSCLSSRKIILSSLKVDIEGIKSFISNYGLKADYRGLMGYRPWGSKVPSWWPADVNDAPKNENFLIFGKGPSNIVVWYNAQTKQAYFSRQVPNETWYENPCHAYDAMNF